MAVRNRMCRQCGGQFEYQISRGADRLYCTSMCVADARRATTLANTRSLPCSIEGCETRRRSAAAPYCEKHYYRLRRRGTMELIGASPVLEHSHGYLLVHAPDHPLCTPGQQHVYEHRKVFFDAHGEGPFQCHVCGAPQGWATMHVDHLNDVRDDNRLNNLAPACPTCNTWRGRHKVDAIIRDRAAKLELNGERLTVAEWATKLGISQVSLRWRLSSGWSLERALTEPRGKTGPRRKATLPAAA